MLLNIFHQNQRWPPILTKETYLLYVFYTKCMCVCWRVYASKHVGVFTALSLTLKCYNYVRECVYLREYVRKCVCTHVYRIIIGVRILMFIRTGFERVPWLARERVRVRVYIYIYVCRNIIGIWKLMKVLNAREKLRARLRAYTLVYVRICMTYLYMYLISSTKGARAVVDEPICLAAIPLVINIYLGSFLVDHKLISYWDLKCYESHWSKKDLFIKTNLG